MSIFKWFRRKNRTRADIYAQETERVREVTCVLRGGEFMPLDEQKWVNKDDLIKVDIPYTINATGEQRIAFRTFVADRKGLVVGVMVNPFKREILSVVYDR